MLVPNLLQKISKKVSRNKHWSNHSGFVRPGLETGLRSRDRLMADADFTEISKSKSFQKGGKQKLTKNKT